MVGFLLKHGRGKGEGGGDGDGERGEGVETKERLLDKLFFSCEGGMRRKGGSNVWVCIP